jgi:hypothetical protein
MDLFSPFTRELYAERARLYSGARTGQQWLDDGYPITTLTDAQLHGLALYGRTWQVRFEAGDEEIRRGSLFTK